MLSSQRNSFTNTRNALVHLENLLECTICKMSATSPVTLGGCEHIFCSECCKDYLGACCPACDLPAHVKDAEVDRQLFNMATLCGRLKEILDDVQDKNGDKLVDSVGDSIYCTPKQGVLDVEYQTGTNLEFTTLKENSTLSAKKRKCKENEENSMAVEKRNIRGKRHSIVDKNSTEDNVTSTSNKTDKADIENDTANKTNKDSKVEAKPSNKKKKTDKGLMMSDSSRKVAEKSPSTTKPNKTRSRRSSLAECNVSLNCENSDTTGFNSKKKSRTTRKSLSRVTAETDTEGTEMKTDNQTNGTCTQMINNISKQSKNTGATEENVLQSNDSASVRGTRKNKQHSKQAKVTKGSKDDEENSSEKQEPEQEKESIRRTPARKKNVAKSTKLLNNMGDTDSFSNHGDMNNSILNDVTCLENDKKKRQKKTTTVKMDEVKAECETPKTGRRKSKGEVTPKVTNKSRAVESPGLNKRNAKGETPLHVAAIKNDVSKVKQLLEKGANPNVRDNAGWTPLHEACNHGYTEVARLLLDHGVMMNVPGFENDSPLHDAVSNNRLDCVKLLVSRGASTNARNLHGLTPLDYAKTQEMKDALNTMVTVPQETGKEVIDVLEYQQPCIVGTGLSREDKTMLQKTANQLKVKLCEEVTPEVTHVVTKCNADGMCPRTIKIVQAVLSGKWILNMEWLALCKEMNSLVCEEAFEVQGLSMFPNCQSPSKGRMNRKQQLPGLFNGCWFYFNGDFEYSVPSKDELTATIKLGGGQFLTREPKPGHIEQSTLTVPYHVDPESDMKDCCIFVVFQTGTKYQPIRTKHVCSVPASWVIDCAATFTLLPLPEV